MATSTTMPTLSPSMTFDEAAQAVISFLGQRWPWGFWSIGRVSDGHQTHMFLEDNAFGVPSGTAVPWEDTICVKMIAGEGPRIAPDVSAVPAYAASRAAQALGVHGYAGMPITEGDGSLFGVLCGVPITA